MRNLAAVPLTVVLANARSELDLASLANHEQSFVVQRVQVAAKQNAVLSGVLPSAPVAAGQVRGLQRLRYITACDDTSSLARAEVLAGPSRSSPVQIQAVVDWLKSESVAVVLQAGDPLVSFQDVPVSLLQGPGIQVIGVAVPVPSAASLCSAKDAQDLQSRLGAAWPWDDGLSDKLHFLIAHDAEAHLCAFLLKGALLTHASQQTGQFGDIAPQPTAAQRMRTAECLFGLTTT